MDRHRPQRRAAARRVSRRDALKGLGALAITAAGCSSDPTAPANAGAGGGGTGQLPAPTPMPAGASGGAAVSNPAVGTGGAGGAPSGAAGAAGATTPSGGAPGAGGSGGAAGTAGEAGSMAAGGGAGGAAGAGASTDLDALQCVVTPAMTEGPFFVEEELNRSDLVMGETADAIVMAAPLHLVIGVFDVNGMTCSPRTGVQVDIWHADAVGVYSDVASGAVQSIDTRGQTFLRGYQVTDAQGVVAFDTIYPGWYRSRAIHIHFKLRMPGALGGASEFVSQMFFDETINAEVMARPAYSDRSGTRSVLNDGDHIYNGTATNSQRPPAGTTPPGKLIMPLLTAMGSGYSATLKIGLRS